jgi:hypothetical protein
MKCRVGDLAVVVDAYYRSNLGRIVRVLAPHDGAGDIFFTNVGQVWLVECAQPMTWSVGRRRYRRTIGPVPDSRLQPIRGVLPRDDASGSVKKRLQKPKRSKEAVEA